VSNPYQMGDSHLHSSWTVYFHHPDDTKWDDKSFKVYSVINTIQDFWFCYRSLPPDGFCAGMFFMMRDDIKPLWEDPRNRDGGCWSYKVAIPEVYDTWIQLGSRLVSEILTENTQEITGIELSPKKGDFCILKVWKGQLSDGMHQSDQILTIRDVPLLEGARTIFTVFRAKQTKHFV